MINRIIIVDDSEGEALLVQQQLREAGFREPVYWLKDGETAISYLTGEGAYSNRKQHPIPDVILLDLGMPEIDGYQFLTWLRHQPGLAKIFVVVLTGEMDPKRIQLAYQLGANSYLAKHSGSEEYKNFVDFLRSFTRVVNTLPKPFDGESTLPAITAVPDATVPEQQQEEPDGTTGDA